MNIYFASRDFTPWAWQPAAAWQVEKLTWTCQGGPDVGSISAPLEVSGLERWIDLLRRPVELYDDSGRAVWWGYVATVEICQGASRVSYSLDQLVNTVKVRYTDTFQTQHVLEESDSLLKGLYGEKEEVLDLGSSTTDRARNMARGILLRKNSVRGPWSSGQPAGSGRVRLVLRGWWHTMAWRLFAFTGQGNLETGYPFSAPQEARVGEAATNVKGKQILIDTVGNYPSFLIQDIEFFAYAAGAPQDNLVVSLYEADWRSNSLIGGPLDSAVVPGPLSSSMSLVQVHMNSTARLGALRSLALVWSRSGGYNATNFYKIGVYPTPSGEPVINPYQYLSGSTWANRIPLAVAAVKMYGGSDTGELVRFYAGAEYGGQFLKQVLLDEKSGVIASSVQDKIFSCKHQAEDLLNMGTADNRLMLVQVDINRVLRIYKAGPPSSYDVLVQPEGSITDLNGNLLRPGDPIAGRWARMTAWPDSPAVMIARVIYEDGKLRVSPAGEKD